MSSNYGAIPDYYYLEDNFPDQEWGEDAAYAEQWPEEYDSYDYEYGWVGENTAVPIPVYLNGWLIVGVTLFALIVLGVAFQNRPVSYSKPVVQAQESMVQLSDDATAVIAPYTDYRITQGLHGQSYGHLAIDLAAGRGELVYSPINGRVSDLYTDEYGNPTLVIENDVYIVTLLHGDYSVGIGDEIEIGQQVGLESNHGYTKDMMGNLCYGRDYCGNHTHLNIYDKRIQANVNPFDLIDRTPLASN